jgi:hypothetical protein
MFSKGKTYNLLLFHVRKVIVLMVNLSLTKFVFFAETLITLLYFAVNNNNWCSTLML